MSLSLLPGLHHVTTEEGLPGQAGEWRGKGPQPGPGQWQVLGRSPNDEKTEISRRTPHTCQGLSRCLIFSHFLLFSLPVPVSVCFLFQSSCFAMPICILLFSQPRFGGVCNLEAGYDRMGEDGLQTYPLQGCVGTVLSDSVLFARIRTSCKLQVTTYIYVG